MSKAKSTILLLDNEPALDELYKNVFEEAGYNFIVTDNINRAVKLCRQEDISLVLSNMLLTTDNQTGEKLGFVLLKTLKVLPKTQSIPVIIFTNLVQEENKKQASNLGAADFLAKSDYTPKELVKKVSRIFKIKN